MFENLNLKRDFVDPTEPPSKKIKKFKAPIFFLLPTEVEKAANLACETQKKGCCRFPQKYTDTKFSRGPENYKKSSH